MALWLETVGPQGWRAASAAAGVSDEQVFRWARAYPEFREAMAMTSAETALRLERTVDAIATGEIDASPTMLNAAQFRLRGLRPDVYRERASVQVDATTRSVGDGDGTRARLLLAEWTCGPGADAPAR